MKNSINRSSGLTAPRARQAVTLNLSPRAGGIVSTVRRDTGVTQAAFIERLLEWYAAQDPRIRTMILSPYAEVRRGLAGLIVEEMRANPLKDFDGAPLPQAAFDALIDHAYERTPPPPREAAPSRGSPDMTAPPDRHRRPPYSKPKRRAAQ